MIGRAWGALAALALTAAPAAAQERVAEFRSGGVAFQVPMPDGYCEPAGPYVEMAKVLAASDAQSVTHLTLLPCTPAPAGTVPSYVLLKTPKDAMGAKLELETFLRDVGAAFDNPDLASLLASKTLVDEAAASVSDALGTRIDFSGALEPRGKDERCAYLGGIIRVQSSEVDRRVSTGICVTVVAGHLLSINWYGADKASAGVVEQLVQAKRLAARIRTAPAK